MITIAVASVLSVVVLVGGYAYYVCSHADLIVFTSSSGKEYTVDCSRWFGRCGPQEKIRSSPEATEKTDT